MIDDAEDREEALMGVISHYGFPILMEEIEHIINKTKLGVLSVTLDKNPEIASMALYAERMKVEGALAVMAALHKKIADHKLKMKRSAK
jgi:hypothetical protein